MHARGIRGSSSRLGLWAALVPLCAAANPFYVATNGFDGWSGLLAAPTPTLSDGPFQTLPHAQQAVRDYLSASPTGDVHVVIRGGTYALESPLVFDGRDSRPAGSRTWWSAFPGEVPVLSGGRRIIGWQPQPGASNRWFAIVPPDPGGEWTFNQLYLNDARATRARFPNAGDEDLIVTEVSDGNLRIHFDRGWGGEDLTAKSAELFMYHEWSCSRAAVIESGVNEVRAPAPVGVLDHAATTARVGDRVFLEHAYSFLDQPGEWYFERTNRWLYLVVEPGQDPNTMDVVAPRLEQLLAVRGTWEAPVRGLCFRGLSLEHSLWLLPDIGLPEAQAGHYLPSWFEFTTYVPPVAVEFSNAEDCLFASSRVRHTGADGIGIGAGTRGNTIDGCEISDTGANGISLGWRGGIHPDRSIFTLGAEWPTITDIPSSNAIVDCDVFDAGRYAAGAVGIWTAFAAGTTLAYNRVTDIPYSGISVGFVWDPVVTCQRDATVAWNDVHTVCTRMADGGGLYLLGVHPGTRIEGNQVHDLALHPLAVGSGVIGFYLDNGSSNVFLTANLAFDIAGPAWACRQQEVSGNRLVNNRFGAPPSADMRPLLDAVTGPRQREEPPPFRNRERYLAEDFNTETNAALPANTRAGWTLDGVEILEADEPGLGRMARFAEAGASLETPDAGTALRVASAFLRGTAGSEPVVIEVAGSADGATWWPLAHWTNTLATWTPFRSVVPDPAVRRIRWRRLTPATGGHAVDLEGARVAQRGAEPDLTPPALRIVEPATSQVRATDRLTVTVAARDREGVASVTIAGAPAQFIGNETWQGFVVPAPGSNAVPIVATDFSGLVTSQRLAFVAGATRYVSPAGGNRWPYTNWLDAATTPQAAIDACAAGDLVWVTNGGYASGGRLVDGLFSRIAITNEVTVLSVNGPAATVLLGAGAGTFNTSNAVRCAALQSGLLGGFTLSNGTTRASGDWEFDSLGGGAILSGHAGISNCIVTRCTAFRGGGLHARDDASAADCIIADNMGVQVGGGVYAAADPTLRRCVIRANVCGGWGGGALLDYGTAALIDCLVVGNAGSDGGGVFLVHRGRLLNCTVIGNRASSGAAGISAYSSAGASVFNSIIASNTVGTAVANHAVVAPGLVDYRYCCTAPLPLGALQSFTNDPHVVDAEQGTLAGDSPCVDAGDSQSVLSAHDVHGRPRIVRAVDVGACERPADEGAPALWFTDVPGTVSHDVGQLALTGGVNGAAAGLLRVEQLTTGASCQFTAVARWSAPPLGLAVGTNRLRASVRSLSGALATQDVVIVRGAPGTGLPALALDPPPVLASTATVLSVSGTVDEDAWGLLVVSNATTGDRATFDAAPGTWHSPTLPRSPTAPNTVWVTASNALGGAVTTSLVVTVIGPPALYPDLPVPEVPFLSGPCVLSGTNGDWVSGTMVASNAETMAVATWPAPAGTMNQCGAGLPTANALAFESAWQAFDGDPHTRWAHPFTNEAWLAYDFGAANPRCITGLRVLPAATNGVSAIRHFRVEGSADDHAWTPLHTGELGVVAEWSDHTFANTTAFRWYRVVIADSWTNLSGVAECELRGSGRWRSAPLALVVGTNVVSLTASNAAGETVRRPVDVVRLPPGAGDADGDGSSDYAEWIAGTDPLEARSALRLTRGEQEWGGFVLRWASASNRLYAIERAAVVGEGFAPIRTNIPAAPPENTYTDALAPGPEALFYRIRIQSP